jgi:hypothetical protein
MVTSNGLNHGEIIVSALATLGNKVLGEPECVFGSPDRLRQGLSESEVCLEITSRKILIFVKLSGIGHPLVNEDKTWRISIKEQPKPISRVGCLFVILLHHGKALFITRFSQPNGPTTLTILLSFGEDQCWSTTHLPFQTTSFTDPVSPETFCGMARRENRAAIRKRKNFA